MHAKKLELKHDPRDVCQGKEQASQVRLFVPILVCLPLHLLNLGHKRFQGPTLQINRP